MNTPDLSLFSMALAFLLLVIPLGASYIFKLGLFGSTVASVIRMSVQLLLVGFFLEYIFAWNNIWLNILWFLIMVVFASVSVIRESQLKLKLFLLPTLISFTIANGFVLLYFNGMVVKLTNVLEAQYIIAIGGMLLGNSLKGIVVGITLFYQNIKREQSRFIYSLSLGASQLEAIAPYFRNSLVSALKPTIASMATMGIVFLPGLMTGQILSGLNPAIAIKYQIAIMVA
ncbi:MAG: ABC transporter permease, partial [Bacillota bacterium]|nr:ABC transporter permease [Bacillota bacterium]